MTRFTDYLRHHPTPPPSAEDYKDNTNPDINYINSNSIDNSDNTYNTGNNENSEHPRLVLRLKISTLQTAPKGTRHYKRGQRAAASVAAARGRDNHGGRGRGRGRIKSKDNCVPPVSEIDSSDGVMDQDGLDQDQDSSNSDSNCTTSSSSSSYAPSTLSETEQTAATPLRRSTRVSKMTRVYFESQEYEHEHLMRKFEDAGGRRRDGVQSSGYDVEYMEYFVMPGEYDPDHPEGYYHYQQQQQQQHNTDDDDDDDDDDRSGEESEKSMCLDVEQGLREGTPTFWIALSPRSTRSVSPSRSQSAMPSPSYSPSLGLEMSDDDGEREDGSGYAGDDDTNSVDEEENDDSVLTIMPYFLSIPGVLNENSEKYSVSSNQNSPPMPDMLNDNVNNHNASTQCFPPLPLMPNSNCINNGMDAVNTTVVVDDDRSPSQTETASITVTSGNNDDEEEEDENSTERRSISDQMAIWGCVQYLDLEGRWDQVAVALGLESCPRIREWLESEYYRLQALKESGELSGGDE
ncbi:hypothetical protein K457DRAFT_23435 [Linnemannia elongata AG-77]|uniref:Uncharacterized protein n=1 Tax=Linnemannia elongata AG-77 TaxID=1314771 RepID=A0A197JJ16_9FUNG|nr:hypothetical protein K457DRAFT_23435 [Linnemannia elongata AG-77]